MSNCNYSADYNPGKPDLGRPPALGPKGVGVTGEIETRWIAGLMSQTYAQRLWDLVPHAVQALVDVGSDLVDSFVSGSALVTRAEAAAPRASGLLAQLKTLVARHQTSQSPAHLQQRDLFAQYTRVLQTLARQKPLLLIIDDLQWADDCHSQLRFRRVRLINLQKAGRKEMFYKPAKNNG